MTLQNYIMLNVERQNDIKQDVAWLNDVPLNVESQNDERQNDIIKKATWLNGTEQNVERQNAYRQNDILQTTNHNNMWNLAGQ